MLTVTELAEMTHRCGTAVDIPLIVDAAGGFNEPLHVMRTVREIEQAGGAGAGAPSQRHHAGPVVPWHTDRTNDAVVFTP